MTEEILITVLVLAGILAFLIASLRIVKETDNYVIERLGAYHTTWDVGIHFLIPFIDRVSKVVSLKEQVKDFEPQSVITKDNVTMQIDTVVFYKVTDARKYCYGVCHPIEAIENLTTTTLRNIVGDLDLDETLTSRDTINEKMRLAIDEATDAWGIKIIRLELKNILPPRDIKEAMERQMRAERERREKILLAEGEKKSQVLLAEGEKEATILRAEAAKERKILEAQAEAQALEIAKQAEARGIVLVREAGADEKVIQLKSLEALAKLADGQATKIIVPSNVQDLTKIISLVESVKQEN